MTNMTHTGDHLMPKRLLWSMILVGALALAACTPGGGPGPDDGSPVAVPTPSARVDESDDTGDDPSPDDDPTGDGVTGDDPTGDGVTASPTGSDPTSDGVTGDDPTGDGVTASPTADD